MDDDNVVIRELDVYVSDTLALYLLQLPLKPCYCDPPEIYAAKFKPNNRVLEVEGDRTIPKLISSTTMTNAALGVGVIRDNAMHITPVRDVLLLRPSFDVLKARDEYVEDMSESDEEDASRDKAPTLEQVCVFQTNTHFFPFPAFALAKQSCVLNVVLICIRCK